MKQIIRINGLNAMKTLFLTLIVTLCMITAVHADSWNELNWDSGIWSSTDAINGVCGSANGSYVAFVPTAGLCTAGTSSSVTGTGPWNWDCNGGNGGTNAVCSAALGVSLNLTFAGDGGGFVSGYMSCNSDSACPSVIFPYGTAITLAATPNPTSTFAGWSEVCMNSNGNCDLTMNNSITVTATFMLAPNTMIGTQAYSSIQTAYDAVMSGTIIKLLGGAQAESVIFDLDKSIFIDGGYNADYSQASTETILPGPLRIRAGSVRIRGVKVRSPL